MTIETKLKELENLDKKATPRPWVSVMGAPAKIRTSRAGQVPAENIAHVFKYSGNKKQQMPKLSNAELITTYRNETPKLIQALREAVEGLKLTATQENVTHTVHPRCFCNACKQRETLTRIEARLTEEK